MNDERRAADSRGDPGREGARSDRIAAALEGLARLTGTGLRLSIEGGGVRRSYEGREGDGEGTSPDARLAAAESGGETGPAAVESWTAGEHLEVRLAAGPGPAPAAAARHAREVLEPLLDLEVEVGVFRRELAGRFEEVELLTSAGEMLGSMLGLERAATRLLEETSRVLAANEAEVWLADPGSTTVRRFAACRADGATPPDTGATVHDVVSDASPLARCFRERQPFAGLDGRAGGASVPWLVVPLRHTALHGSGGAVGVLRLRGAPGRPRFRSRDTRLASAVGSHIAAALENRRLLDESVERERMMVEMEVAHDLQLRLLPEPADFADLADVAALCVPAESVGGDFYHLLRLPGDRLGVMLGDVSSHGYSAGLIMALTMSAASLVARDVEDPARVLAGIHRELVRRLESTEMYMTLCYAILDPVRGVLRYANAGHPHAWRVSRREAVRLDAVGPPLGIAEFEAYASRELPWTPGEHTLLMFTDGLSECLRTERMWSDDVLTGLAGELSTETSREVLDRLFDLACAPGGVAADDRTAVVVK